MDDKALEMALRAIVQFVDGNTEEGRRLSKEAQKQEYLNPISHFKICDMIPEITKEQLYRMVS